MMAGLMKVYSLPKKNHAREKVDSSITVHDLQKPLREYMMQRGHRNVWEMLEPLALLQYNAGTPHSILRDFAPLALLYVKVCRKGLVPSSKHRQALQKLNSENVMGQGVLKINFTDLSNDVFIDQVDDRIRVLLKHFRICVSHSIGIGKQRRLNTLLEPKAYELVASVLSEFSDVSCITVPTAGQLSIEDTPTPAIQLAQQAIDSQESMECDGSSSLSMHFPISDGMMADCATCDTSDGSLAPGGPSAEYTSDVFTPEDGSLAPGGPSAEYTSYAIVDASTNGPPSGGTLTGCPSTFGTSGSATNSEDALLEGAEWFDESLLTPDDAERMMAALKQVPKFQEESHNAICMKNMKARKGKRKKPAKKNGPTSTKDEAMGATDEKKAKKKKRRHKWMMQIVLLMHLVTLRASMRRRQETKNKKKGCNPTG